MEAQKLKFGAFVERVDDVVIPHFLLGKIPRLLS